MKLLTPLFIRLVFLSALLVQGMFTISSATAASTNQLKGVRTWPSPDNTRVVLDFLHKPSYQTHYLKNPDRLVIDLESTSTAVDLTKIKHNGPLVNNLRESASRSKNSYRIVVDLNKASQAKIFVLPSAKPYGHRLVIDLPHNKLSTAKVNKPKPQQPQGRDIIIAIDAGHGGDDPGALGRYSYEKKITLQIAKRLLKKINHQTGMSAFLIREGDYYVGLHQRTAIARKGDADFFVSIHADGFTSARPRGASVLVLSKRRATTEQGRWMENNEAHSELIGGAGKMMQGSSNLPYLQKMVLDMSMGNSMAVGFNVGQRVVQELKKVTPLHQSVPVHASLAVLKSPDIPSILVEAGFITNRTEERLLNQAAHQNKITNAIFNGIYKHFAQSPPQNTLFAQKKRVIKHTVRSGESLSVLSERYSVSLNSLKEYNNLSSNSLHVDQVLNIPPDYHLFVTPEPVKQFVRTEQPARVHLVTRGQSLSLIAAQYGTETQTLKDFNNLRSTALQVGQKINIPGSYVEKPVVVNSRAASVHRVSRGESLSVIAAQYGTTASNLKTFNNLSSMSLAIGQKINIPGAYAAKPLVANVRAASVHKVSRGESLSVIAAQYGTTASNLKTFNNLSSMSLAIGQQINIPGAYAAKTVVVNSRPASVHRVSRGESLSVIAAQYGTTASNLKTFNNLSSMSLAIGQQINIPGVNTTPQPIPVRPSSHKVSSGESLSVVADRYNISSDNLQAYNKLHSNSLLIGQVLQIPDIDYAAPLPVVERLHRVKSGESLSVIAQHYDTTASALKTFNNLSSMRLAIGQKIKIPGANSSEVVKATPVRPSSHKVSSGESLSVLANRYNISSGNLKAFNKLNSNSLLIGQVLQIPSVDYVADVPLVDRVHRVKSGESLSVIAQRYETTSSRLKAHNGLSSSTVFVGQKLKVPSAGYVIKEHKVRSGESLSVIASRYGTTSDLLKEFNKLSSTLLRVGQVLTIPVS
ncbi:MAG: N-acetylmuramoyl-L-alanine amidase [Psychromonas sp.]|jgi:N-acetylmuramoyl-L-alanine amidase